MTAPLLPRCEPHEDGTCNHHFDPETGDNRPLDACRAEMAEALASAPYAVAYAIGNDKSAAAERARIRAEVEALPRLTMSGDWMIRWHDGEYLHRDEVLALLEEE